MWLVAALVGTAVLAAGPAGAQTNGWVAASAADFSGVAVDGTRVDPDSVVVLAAVDPDSNLALGHPAVDDFNRTAPLTDGDISVGSGEWLSGTPNVYGRWFIIDLGVDRAITRVRLMPGASALAQPEYYIRGYRLESATDSNPGLWEPLAEETTNLSLSVDTAADSTWTYLDAEGRPQPRVGRWVRLTLIRQDRSNWVALGDIEVYGVGHLEHGWAEGTFTSPAQVNVGRVRWEAEDAPGTRVQVAVAGQDGDLQAVANGALFSGAEPATQVRWRASLSTSSPFATPSLRRLVVEYDPVLVANQVLARVTPDTVSKAVAQEVTCVADVRIQAGDRGVDLLRVEGVPLSLSQVRVAGLELTADRDYTWRALPAEGATEVDLAQGAHIASSATVEIVGSALFLRDRNPVVLSVGSREQGERDGYVNWQHAAEAEPGSAVVLALGPTPGLVSAVQVTPTPFSPFGAQRAAEFRFVVGNLQGESHVGLDIFTLSGERVRRLEQVGGARAYLFAWDGKDEDGRTVDPGPYLYEVRVKAGDTTAARKGALVVAY